MPLFTPAGQAFGPVMRSLYWYIFPACAGSPFGAQTQPTLGTIHYQPMIVGKDTSITALGLSVQATGATSVARMGIYTDGGGIPLTLLAELSGTLDTHTSAAVVTGTFATAVSLQANRLYWIALVTQTGTAPTLHNGTSFLSRSFIGRATADTTGTHGSWTEAGLTSGGLPGTATPAAAGSAIAYSLFARSS